MDSSDGRFVQIDASRRQTGAISCSSFAVSNSHRCTDAALKECAACPRTRASIPLPALQKLDHQVMATFASAPLASLGKKYCAYGTPGIEKRIGGICRELAFGRPNDYWLWLAVSAIA